MMHDGMPYGPIQGQGQGHVALKVRNSSIFKIFATVSGSWQMTTDSLTRGRCLNFIGQIFDACPSFCVT